MLKIKTTHMGSFWSRQLLLAPDLANVEARVVARHGDLTALPGVRAPRPKAPGAQAGPPKDLPSSAEAGKMAPDYFFCSW